MDSFERGGILRKFFALVSPWQGVCPPAVACGLRLSDASAHRSKGPKTVESVKRAVPQAIWGIIRGENRVKRGAASEESQLSHHAGVVSRPLLAFGRHELVLMISR